MLESDKSERPPLRNGTIFVTPWKTPWSPTTDQLPVDCTPMTGSFCSFHSYVLHVVCVCVVVVTVDAMVVVSMVEVEEES